MYIFFPKDGNSYIPSPCRSLLTSECSPLVNQGRPSYNGGEGEALIFPVLFHTYGSAAIIDVVHLYPQGRPRWNLIISSDLVHPVTSIKPISSGHLLPYVMGLGYLV